MSIITFLLPIGLLGLVLGFLGGFLGTGGGTFAIPTLVIFGGYDQKLAQGTALVMVVANLFLALLRYRRQSGLDLRFAFILAASASISSWISSSWALTLPSSTLQLFYGSFLLALAVFVFFTKSRRRVRADINHIWAIVPGFIGGVSLGLFGVGGAMLAVPLLVLFFGQTQVKAQGLGLSLALPGCLISLFQYSQAQQVDWLPGIALAIGGLATVPYGVRLAHRVDERTLVRAFCILLAFAGFILLLKSL